ncbi:MlaD family protein [Jannaschia donghaensis]|uniref:Virulence factor Mce family protein n=1 Tax=Jannaschia donghaensis TaxID=420998 RepID=A0A0M6YK65_9RHOB|nr:MlaD family protein [Jannaschia donghaensis]CTQ50340.1 virulence factor Mce family protein [Jannaschia donghaensis]
MEIKANFVLIGAFTLLGIGAILAAFLWLGALRVDGDVARYGILFDDVSGLSPSGEVVFNGLPVGRVVSLRLHDANPALIYALIEVDAATPVRSDTVAQLTVQGVTGVSYIALIGGQTDAARLQGGTGDVPMIPSRRTGLQTLMTDVPGLLAEGRELIADLRLLAGPGTQARVAGILANTEAATGKLNSTLDGLDGLTTGLVDAADQVGVLAGTVAALEGDIRGTLTRADTALVAVTRAVNAAQPVIAATGTLLSTDVPQTLAAWRIAGEGTAPLIRRADDALTAVAAAAEAVTTLTTGEGAALIGDASGTVAALTPALRDDLPAAMGDLRAASEQVRTGLSAITQGLTEATEQIDPLATETRAAVAAATNLLERAGPTLERLDGTIGSVETAIAAAGRVIETDVGPALGDFRRVADVVARDLPGLTARADAVLSDIGSAASAVTPGLRSFGTSTLPQIDALASEARAFVRALTAFLRRIESDPAGALQGQRVPEYRR